MARVKVCGLTRETDLRAAVNAGVDAVGVVSEVPVDTPREVDGETARELLASAPPFVATVLVTIAEDGIDPTAGLVKDVGPDVVQVHGELDAEAVEDLSAAVDARVVPVVSCAELERAVSLDGVADALLVDSESDDGGGGTGRTHDWDATAEIVRQVDVPVVLAGGLTPENVAEAVRRVDPFAVDVASGVESSGGVKDHDALAAFVREATGERGAPA
jgi:phosphoribosylanthranilate isomerase